MTLRALNKGLLFTFCCKMAGKTRNLTPFFAPLPCTRARGNVT